MTLPRDRLITSLVDDLAPVRRRAPVATPTFAWLVLAAGFVTTCYLLVQPFRPGFLGQLLVAPRFALETALGIASAALLCAGGLALAVPALGSPWRRLAPALTALSAWVALNLYAFAEPALTVSMLGKRSGCIWEVLLAGTPPLVVLLWLARRRWPLRGAVNGLALGLGAGALAATLMQLACLYEPAHNFLFHLLPGLALGGLGMAAGARFLRTR